MRARLTAVAGLTAASLLTTGLLLAPAASADNYAPELPPASTGQINNPTSAEPVGAPGSGIVIVNSTSAGRAREVATPPAATKAADAPTQSVRANTPVAPTVTGLPAGKTVRASLVVDGDKVDLGKVKVGADGSVTLPAVRGKAGTSMTVKMTDADGKNYYVTIKFAKKRR